MAEPKRADPLAGYPDALGAPGLAAVLDAVRDEILLLAEDGAVVFANVAACRNLGYSRQQILALNRSDITADISADAWRGIWARTMREAGGDVRATHRRRDGSTYPVEALLSRTDLDGRSLICVSLRDISERQALEDALRLGERRAQDFADAAAEWFCETDDELRFVSISGPARDVVGGDNDNIIGLRPWEIGTIDAPPGARARQREAFQGRTPFRNFIFSFVDPMGRRQYRNSAGRPYVDDRGNFLGYRIIVKDWTENQATLDALRKTSLSLERVLDTSPSIILQLRSVRGAGGAVEDFVFERVNRAGLDLLRNVTADPTGRSATGIWPGMRSSGLFDLYARAADGERPPPTERHYDADGIDAWYHITAVPLDDGVLVTANDITVRKKAEIALAAAQERLELALSGTSDGLWDWNIATNEVYRSPRWYHVFGHDPVDFPAHHDAWEDIAHPADRDTVMAEIRRLLEGDGATFAFEYRLRHRDGEYRWSRSRGTIVRDGAGRAVRVVGFDSDVTAEKTARDHMARAREKAEAADIAKTNFLANMSHELRTPLNAIIGFSEIMASALLGPIDPRYREYANHILSSGGHLLSLIDDILDFSKAEVGKVAPRRQLFRIEAEIDAALEILGGLAEREGIAIERLAPPGLPAMYADPRLVRQILINLMSNAIKFTDRGGRVRVAAALDAAGRMTLTVSDTGIGMTSDEVVVALAPFGQNDAAHSRTQPGTGLGLPLAQRFVEAHGGTLEVDSAPGRGTTVCATFPAAPVGAVFASALAPSLG